MTLTKKEALKKTLEMWEWLAETGKDKSDYFTEVKPEDKYKICCNCYLCEYCDNSNRATWTDRDCTKCPVDWGTIHYDKKLKLYCDNDGLPYKDQKDCVQCQVSGSPYNTWRHINITDTEKSKEYANKIVILIKEAIERENNG